MKKKIDILNIRNTVMKNANNKSFTVLRAQKIRVHTITSEAPDSSVDRMKEENNPQKQAGSINEKNKLDMMPASKSDEADFIAIQVAKIVARKGLSI